MGGRRARASQGYVAADEESGFAASRSGRSGTTPAGRAPLSAGPLLFFLTQPHPRHRVGPGVFARDYRRTMRSRDTRVPVTRTTPSRVAVSGTGSRWIARLMVERRVAKLVLGQRHVD